MNSVLTDKNIIKAIASGGRVLEQTMTALYSNGEYKNAVSAFILKFGGKESDIEDLFQDGIVHLVMNIRKGTFKGESSIKTYFLTICKNIWFQQLRRENKFRTISQALLVEEKSNITPEVIVLFNERKAILGQVLDKIGRPCKNIISLWALNYSMKEIAKKTGYKNDGVVRKKKYLCLQSLIKLVKGNRSLMQQLSN